jgi:hypothetical protein
MNEGIDETYLGREPHCGPPVLPTPRFTFTVGDKVTIEGTGGVWRIKALLGEHGRIADLVRVDRTWTAATSAYTYLLRPVEA